MFNSLFSKISFLFVFVCAVTPVFAPKKGGHSPGKASRRSSKAGSPGTSPSSAGSASPEALSHISQIAALEKQLRNKDLTSSTRGRLEASLSKLKKIPPFTLE